MMDREQFTSAVLAAEPTLYRVAKTMLRSEHDCADAAQQAILRAWEQLDSLRSTRYFKTWLVRILINECSTILRRQQRLAPYDAAAAEAIPAPAVMITATCMPPSPHWRKSCACRWSCTT